MSDSASPASDDGLFEAGKPKPTTRLVNGSARAAAERLLEFLNRKTGKRYRPMTGTLEPIMARLKDGASEEDCRSVIANRVRAWKDDDRMRDYLRPATLFNRTKFAQYLGELGAGLPLNSPGDSRNEH